MVTQVAIPAPAGGHIGAWYLEPAGGGAGAAAVLYVHGVHGMCDNYIDCRLHITCSIMF